MNGIDDLLLLTYRFPPTGGVGSRRWAKFSKYLSRLDWRIHVVAANFCLDDKVNWARDVAGNDNVLVHRVSTRVPGFFFKPARSLLQRLGRRIALGVMRRHKEAIDIAEFALSDYVTEAKKLISARGINKVVASGPPGSLFYAGALLKIDCPNIELTLDYRDAWVHDRDFHFPERIGLDKKRRIIACEAFALRAADRVVVVTEDMRTMLLQTYRIDPDKVRVIHNGFDREDYPAAIIAPDLPHSPEVLRIFYGGVLGTNPDGRLRALVELAKCCEGLASEGVCIEFLLCSDLQPDFFATYESSILREATRCSPMVDHASLVHEILAADVCLSINDMKDPHAFGTKIFDYMALGRPMFHVSNGGRLSELLEQCGEVTATYDPLSLSAALLDLWRRHRSGALRKQSVSYECFNLKSLAARYDALLRERLN
ncbi:MAG: glycosyltransferase [Castellaniella sp.]|uniref:glycosyltransferase n=1 Tax=Castellaniella sp. TaxID=1955812 RepID=UPI003C791B67